MNYLLAIIGFASLLTLGILFNELSKGYSLKSSMRKDLKKDNDNGFRIMYGSTNEKKWKKS